MTTTFDEEFENAENPLDPNNEEDLEQIIRILQKSSNQRTKQELKTLYLLLKDVEFLKSFWATKPAPVCYALLKALRYDYTQKSNAVFYQGDEAKYFYLILKGSVFVLIPAAPSTPSMIIPKVPMLQKTLTKEMTKDDKDISTSLHKLDTSDERQSRNLSPEVSSIGDKTHRKSVVFSKDENLVPKKSTTRRESILKSSINILSPQGKPKSFIARGDSKGEELVPRPRKSSIIFGNVGPLQPEALPLLYPNNKLVNALKEKDYFGDIAMKLSTKRTATIVAREFCHFMTLDNRAFNTIIRRYQEDEQRETLTFFKTTSLTRDWPYSSIVGLMRHFKTVKFARNQVIYSFGDPIESIYFVKSGEVEIIEEADLKVQQEKMPNRKRSSLNVDKMNLVAMNNVWKKKQQDLEKQQIRVAILGYQQSFGEEEFFKKSEVRQTKAVVRTGQAEILVVPCSKLFENAKDPEQFKNLLSSKNAKTKWRESFENDIVETSQALSTEDIIGKGRKSRTMSTVFINGVSGFKKQSSRSPKISEHSYNPEAIQPGTVNRLMQYEMAKKVPLPSKDFLKKLKDPKNRKTLKSMQSSRTVKVTEHAKSVMPTFRGESQEPRSITTPQSPVIEKNILLAKSTSVSKAVSPTESTTAIEDFTKHSMYPQTPIANGFKSPARIITSATHNNRIDTRLTMMESPILSISPLFSPMQSGVSNKSKLSNMLQNDASRQSLNERLGIKKLFIDDAAKPATSHRAPLQFYVNSPKKKEADEVIETKESIMEKFSSIFQPKIKVNTGSPRLISKIKNHMKSFQSPSAIIAAEAVQSHRAVEVSKLNKFVNSKNRSVVMHERLSPEFFQR